MTPRGPRRATRFTLLVVCLALGACPLPAAAGSSFEAIDSPMYRSPELPLQKTVFVFPEKATALWLRALEWPDADLRRQAADAFALAHRRGFKGFEAAVPALVKALERADEHPAVRLAVARALITLDARGAAPSLLGKARKGDLEMREAVEPALARWDYRPARAVWLERLG